MNLGFNENIKIKDLAEIVVNQGKLTLRVKIILVFSMAQHLIENIHQGVIDCRQNDMILRLVIKNGWIVTKLARVFEIFILFDSILQFAYYS